MLDNWSNINSFDTYIAKAIILIIIAANDDNSA